MKPLLAYLFKLTNTNWVHGLIMAFGGGVATGLTSCFSGPTPHAPGKSDLLAALWGGIGMALFYIFKNKTAGTGTKPSNS
jgi:hypothetical protein